MLYGGTNWQIIALVMIGTALVHLSFQLPLSSLLLTGSHGLGRKIGRGLTLRLVISQMLGIAVVHALLLFAMLSLLEPITEIAKYLLFVPVVTGIGIMFFYFKPAKTGTQINLPEKITSSLRRQSKTVNKSTKSFWMGIKSAFFELHLVAMPALVMIVAVGQINSLDQRLIAAFIYLMATMLPLIILSLLTIYGGKIARIQNWREKNKHFFQTISGITLILVSVFVMFSVVWEGTRW